MQECLSRETENGKVSEVITSLIIKPERLLPCRQEPVIDSYHELTSQMNPAHILARYIFNICFNIIIEPMSVYQ